MAMARDHSKAIFRKMERELLKLSSAQPAENVHRFRTSTRRLQILLEELVPAPGGNHKKLLKLLNRIRRRAGKVRDLDVQIAALQRLKVPQEPRRKIQLLQSLLELRAKSESRLRKSLKKSQIREARKRLRRVFRGIRFESIRDPLAVAKQILGSAPMNAAGNEESLHRCRLAVKRARYAAEFCPPSKEVTPFLRQLRQLQDALGDWHDWLTLTDTAVEQFGEVNQSSLVAVLHNTTRGKFRQAVAAIAAWQAANQTAGSGLAAWARPRKSAETSAPPAVGSQTAA